MILLPIFLLSLSIFSCLIVATCFPLANIVCLHLWVFIYCQISTLHIPWIQKHSRPTDLPWLLLLLAYWLALALSKLRSATCLPAPFAQLTNHWPTSSLITPPHQLWVICTSFLLHSANRWASSARGPWFPCFLVQSCPLLPCSQAAT